MTAVTTVLLSVISSVIVVFVLEPVKVWMFKELSKVGGRNIKIDYQYSPKSPGHIQLLHTEISNHLLLGVEIYNTTDVMKIVSIDLIVDGKVIASSGGPWTPFKREINEVGSISLSLTDAALALKHEIKPGCSIKLVARLIIGKKLKTIKRKIKGETLKNSVNYLNTRRLESMVQ